MANTETANDGSPQPRPRDQTIALLVNRVVVGPVLSRQQDKIYYFDEAGQLYLNPLDGSKEETFGFVDTPRTFGAIWPDAGGDIIIKAARVGFDGTAYRLYRSTNGGSFKNLPLNIESIDWLPGGQKYVYLWHNSNGGYELDTAESATDGFSKIANLPSFSYVTAAPTGTFVLLREPAALGKTNRVQRFDLNTKLTTTLLDRGTNLGVSISPDGNLMLFTRVSEGNGLPELWLQDFTKQSFTNLGLNTAVEKIVWSKDSTRFYYALPQAVPKDDLQLRAATADQLYVYDIDAGSKTKIDLGNKTPDLRDLLLTADQKILFFRDGQDGKLYRVNLK